MDNRPRRLPVEMWDHIIDSLAFADIYLRSELYRTWCVTALVCSTWLRRSRFNIYRKVLLQRSSQFDSLFRTLEGNPHLAHLVVELEAYGDWGEYIPFPRLPPLLKNCAILHLYDMDWKCYPPGYTDTCLYPFSLLGIVTLRLMVSRSTARGLLNFIHSLKKLENLTLLTSDEYLPKMEPIAEPDAGGSPDRTPTALSKLEVTGMCVSIKFPPRYFGDAVVDLLLEIEHCEISPELLHCIEHFQRLQTLNIKFFSFEQDDNFYDPRSNPQSMSKVTTLLSILTSVSCSNLHVLTIDFRPDDVDSYALHFGYYVERSGLLDLLAGDHMRAVLDGFSSLTQLDITLHENDAKYDEMWWKQEMARRLPSRLHAALSVFLYEDTSSPCLWFTAAQIVDFLNTNDDDFLNTDDDFGNDDFGNDDDNDDNNDNDNDNDNDDDDDEEEEEEEEETFLPIV